MRRPLLLALLLCLVLCPFADAALPPFAADPVPPNETATAIIKSVGDGKLSTDLALLVEPAARLPEQTEADVVGSLRTTDVYRDAATSKSSAGEAYVYVSLEEGSATSLVEPFVTVVARDEEHGIVSAWIAVDRIPALAAQPFVRSIRTVNSATADAGLIMTEGDAALKANALRAATGLTGAGIKVGVVSGGVDTWNHARTSGDLPANFHVLSNRGGGDEGTAMCEIVHDIAPGVELYFHDWGDGDNYQLFIQAVQALANAGCKVIVDDIAWADQPYFEDGPVAQATEALIASRGIVYVSSGGNSAQRHYQGVFRGQSGGGSSYHDFRNGGTGKDQCLYATIPAGGGLDLFLQWNDQWGRAANDYDLYLCRLSDASYLSWSSSRQDGNDDPLEVIRYKNSGTTEESAVVWVWRASGEARELEIFMRPSGGTSIDPVNIVAADSVPGNHASANQIAVAAADVATPDVLESFSSRGPATFRWPVAVTRQKPDITGSDGGMITGAGGFGKLVGGRFRFYGTSAAAPHVGGLVALAWSGKPTATNAQVRTALLQSARDMGPAGYDSGWGAGYPDALAFASRLGIPMTVVTGVPGGSAVPQDLNNDGKYEDVNGNGRKDFADIVLYFNQMTWIAANEPIAAFDCNANGRIDFADVVWLFNHL